MMPIRADIPIFTDLYDFFIDVVTLDIPGMEYLEAVFESILLWAYDTAGVPWVVGVAIIASAMRLLLAPLSVWGKKNTLRMVVVRPYVQQISKRFADDREQQGLRMGELMEDNRVRLLPLVIPWLVQVPIFLALYRVMLRASTDESSLFGVIHDVTQPLNEAGTTGFVLLGMMLATQVYAVRVVAMRRDRWIMMLAITIMAFELPFVSNFPVGVIVFLLITQVLVIFEHFIILRTADFEFELVSPADDEGVKQRTTIDLAQCWREGTLGTAAATPSA